MSIQHNTLLEKVLEYAKSVTERDSAPTAESFLTAVLDVIGDSAPFNTDKYDRAELEKIFEARLHVSGAALLSLRPRFVEAAMRAADPEAFFSGILERASEQARKMGMPFLTVQQVLGVVLDNPSDALKNVFSQAGAGAGSAGGNVPSSDSVADAVTSFAAATAAATAKDKGTEDKSGGPSDTPAPQPEAAPPATPKERRAAIAKLTSFVKTMNDNLNDKVLGQENAVNMFCTGYFQGELNALTETDRVRPRASFLFAGPPGVGKTFLAEQGAAALGLKYKRFDMSEYSDREANFELCGTNSVYKGSKEGILTSFVEKTPRCVLLFDEIEKAHLNVLHLFLQILDAGVLLDNFTTRKVSFKDTVIIFTTNAGKNFYDSFEGDDFSAVSRKVIMNALGSDVKGDTGEPFFPPALCSRFATGNVVMFNRISAHVLRNIAEKVVRRNIADLEKAAGITVEADERVFSAILFAEGGAADARSVTARAESFFNEEYYELLRLIDSEKKTGRVEDLEKIRLTLELPPEGSEERRLFCGVESDRRVLVFANPDLSAACARACPEGNLVCVGSVEDGERELRRGDTAFALIDLTCGVRSREAFLNVEDVESEARDFLQTVREEYPNVPVYLLQPENGPMTPEEQLSFGKQGVRGVISFTEAGFSGEIGRICDILYQQETMRKLATSNRLATFETAQLIEPDGRTAEIRLFDFRMNVAVGADDTKNIMRNVSRPDVSFADIYGAEGAKEELGYFLQYLKNPKKYTDLGVPAPKGVLLYGPPGTGKTMLAKALASEADVTFIATEGSAFIKKYIGEGKDQLGELFATARKYAPAIIFIDEIDSIARTRTGGDHAAANGEDVLTRLLAEMDGFKTDPSKPVFVLAATNYSVDGDDPAKQLDPAVTRRFDRRIFVDLPRKEDRVRYLRDQFAKKPIFGISEAEIENIAVRSTGMSLAQLAGVISLSLRTAVRGNAARIDDAAFEEAFETFIYGDEKKWDASLLERTARHEAGHTLLYWLAGNKPSYVTVVARGRHGGYMQHGDTEDKGNYTKAELLALIRTSLGGRAAELEYYGENDGLATGPSSDLQNATRIAEQIVCVYGMDADFGLAVPSSRTLSDAVSLQIREAVNRILNEQMLIARAQIAENRDRLDRLVTALLEKDHLAAEEIEACLRG